MSSTFDRLPRDFQLFIELECRIQGIPYSIYGVEFSEETPKPREEDKIHQLPHDLGIVVERYGQQPRLQLGAKGREILKQLEEWEKVGYPPYPIPAQAQERSFMGFNGERIFS